MSIVRQLERLIGIEKKRHHKKKDHHTRAPKKRQPKALREYWEKKRKQR